MNEFRIDLEKFSSVGDFRVTLRIASTPVISPPQSLVRHLSDLTANKRFLAERRLVKFFLADEPLFNLDYADIDFAEAYVFTAGAGPTNKHVEILSIDMTLIELAKIITCVEGELADARIDRQTIFDQIELDLKRGAYDEFLIQGRSTTGSMASTR